VACQPVIGVTSLNQPPAGARCSCGGRAVTFLRYSGAHLCARCFQRSVEQRARRELRRQATIEPGTKVAVAVSGGKDSLAALTLVHDLVRQRRGVELMAVTVDEGIARYRPASLEAAAGVCARLGVDHRVVSMAHETLLTIDRVAAGAPERAPCSYCGVLRRKLANTEARRWGADYLATGHNLDDIAQSIFMSFVRGDLGKLARLAPHDEVKEGLVPRILPLRLIPEKEVFLFALLSGLPIQSEQCPHMGRAARGPVKEMLMALEDATPGTRHAIVSAHERLRPALRAALAQGAQGPPIDMCPRCGEPSAAGVCQACLLLDELIPVSQSPAPARDA
jgi:uncharacterized protein (TIGR00269 family)